MISDSYFWELPRWQQGFEFLAAKIFASFFFARYSCTSLIWIVAFILFVACSSDFHKCGCYVILFINGFTYSSSPKIPIRFLQLSSRRSTELNLVVATWLSAVDCRSACEDAFISPPLRSCRGVADPLHSLEAWAKAWEGLGMKALHYHGATAEPRIKYHVSLSLGWTIIKDGERLVDWGLDW